MSNAKNFKGFSEADVRIIHTALNTFLDSPEQIIINDNPIPKMEAATAILDKLQNQKVEFTIKELIVIKGCLTLYRRSLPWLASRRVYRKVHKLLHT